MSKFLEKHVDVPIVTFLAIMVIAIGVIVYFEYKFSERKAECASLGGVYIRDRGNFTCIKADALITIPPRK